MSTTTFFGTLRHYTCGQCGCIYGLESGFDDDRRRNGKSFYCPNGHSLSYHETALMRAEKAAKRAQELLDQQRRQTDVVRGERDFAERQRNAERAAKARIKNRVKHGVCPCCSRTFKQLAEHMKAKHPEYVKETP